MNIFRLDDDAQLCAQYHTDRHVVKMLSEYCELLSTAHHVLGTKFVAPDEICYETNVHNPSAKWVRQSASNYKWLHKLAVALAREYTLRYGKVHAYESRGMLKRLGTLPLTLKDVGPTKQLLTMPERYHVDNPVVAYRNYYVNEKSHLFDWRERDMPPWLVQFGFVPVEEES